MSDIQEWNVEDEQFWESTGKKVANRNLWISIPSLLCGFAVWLYWGIITVQMLNLGFPFEKSELFTLAAITEKLIADSTAVTCGTLVNRIWCGIKHVAADKSGANIFGPADMAGTTTGMTGCTVTFPPFVNCFHGISAYPFIEKSRERR